MEKTLRNLFDFQRFEQNEHLASLISNTQSRFAKELNDDMLEQVSAAGDVNTIASKKDDKPRLNDDNKPNDILR